MCLLADVYPVDEGKIYLDLQTLMQVNQIPKKLSDSKLSIEVARDSFKSLDFILFIYDL